MSTAQNLAYSIVQVVHNFGAVAAVGGSFAAVKSRSASAKRQVALIALAGWITQGASGAALGAVSYYFYGRFPDISGIALYALLLKMACAVAGFMLLAAFLYRADNWTEMRIDRVCQASLALAITAIAAAAFLRWFS